MLRRCRLVCVWPFFVTVPIAQFSLFDVDLCSRSRSFYVNACVVYCCRVCVCD